MKKKEKEGKKTYKKTKKGDSDQQLHVNDFTKTRNGNEKQIKNQTEQVTCFLHLAGSLY